jgi:hypothetical protein
MFIVRTIRNTQIHSIGRMQSFSVLKKVVHWAFRGWTTGRTHEALLDMSIHVSDFRNFLLRQKWFYEFRNLVLTRNLWSLIDFLKIFLKKREAITATYISIRLWPYSQSSDLYPPSIYVMRIFVLVTHDRLRLVEILQCFPPFSCHLAIICYYWRTSQFE